MRKSVILWIVILGVFLVSGCSGDTEATTDGVEKKEDLTTVKVAYMPNYASLNTVVAGMNIGSFEDEGLKVELVEFADGPTIIAAMESGSIDIGYIGPGAHVLSIKGSADIFAFSHIGNADEVIGNTEKGVKTIEDLKGKTIAVASGTSSEMILNMTLDEAGISRDEVKLMDMDASAIVTAMISGSVDAVATWSPNTSAIKREMGDKALMLSNNERYAETVPSIASWVVKPEYAEKNSELLEKFTRGLYKGMDYRVDNLEEVAEWVAKVAALDPESVKKETGDGNWITSEELLAMIDDGRMESYYKAQQDNFVKEERLTESELVPVSDYVLFDNMLNAK
jgi:NitT/TauT family transport system substrate-binding protein